MEGATGRWVAGAGDFAGESDALGGFLGGGFGDGGEQSNSVWMFGILVELGRGGDFDDAAEVHDGDAVGKVLDDGEIVSDEEIGEAEVALEVFEEV